jgi:hypothetical protein
VPACKLQAQSTLLAFSLKQASRAPSQKARPQDWNQRRGATPPPSGFESNATVYCHLWFCSQMNDDGIQAKSPIIRRRMFNIGAGCACTLEKCNADRYCCNRTDVLDIDVGIALLYQGIQGLHKMTYQNESDRQLFCEEAPAVPRCSPFWKPNATVYSLSCSR